MLWQHALKVVGQYAQVAQKVTERVLPDLDLAVQEAQPNLGVELLGMVEGWIQQMTMDGDTTRRLCDELSKQMGDLITEAQKERVLSEAPQVPRPEAISNGADQTRQVLLDGLVAFAEQMSKGAADEGKSQELVELLFMSPGMGAPRLEAGERQIPETKSTSSEEGKPETGQIGYTSVKLRDLSPSSGAPTSLTPETPSEPTPSGPSITPQTGQLALLPAGILGGAAKWSFPGRANAGTVQMHPLLRALYELHQVSDILRQCTSFWGHIEGTVKELSRSKDHTLSLLRYASKSQRLKERFDQRLTEYSAFWASLLALCENYCAEVQPALQQMSQFLRDAEVAADVRDAVSAAQMEASERRAALTG